MLLHLFCLSVEDTLSLPWEKREFLFSICVISLSFFTPVQSPWFPTGQTLITEWTFQKPQRQKRCLCDRTVQTKENFLKKKKTARIWTGFLTLLATLLAIFSFYFLQDLIYHLNSSYKKCITTVPEDVTRIILYKREKNIMAAISLFTNMFIFFNKESRFPGGQGLNHAANLYFKTYVALRLCWEVKKKKRKKVWISKIIIMSQITLDANMTHDSD